MKHDEDGGDLTMFGGADEILFACNRGHYWVIRVRRMDVAQASVERGPSLERLQEQFGQGVTAALGLGS
jgi:hypothetical protein